MAVLIADKAGMMVGWRVHIRAMMSNGSSCNTDIWSSLTRATYYLRMAVPKWETVVKRFPRLSSVFAYGSAVFPQSTKPGADAMTDLLFVVQDARQWHRDNMTMNPSDYSQFARKMLRADGVVVVQEWPGGMWFNAGCVVGGVLCKYGVVSVGRAVDDLVNWRDFTFAGRLQKPVICMSSSCGDIVELNDRVNRPSALLHSLSNHINNRRSSVTWNRVLSDIVGLSYKYDVRMLIAEDRRKVERIVEHQFDALRDIYTQSCAVLQVPCDRERVYLDDPPGIFKANRINPWRIITANAVQSLKGLLSADPHLAWRYLLRKIRKRFTH